jgi:Glyoxalase-like domain
MHRSRLAGFSIDCLSTDLAGAAAFWGAALGMVVRETDGPSYLALDASARDLSVEVQKVQHPSRVHLDIEADDVEGEVARLEGLGAKRVEKVRTWWVMEAPTGQRFCVIEAKHDLATLPGSSNWAP